MAPQISISPATFARLQKHAEPLVDDIESLINKLIDEREKKQGTASPPPGGGAKEYGKGTSPNLTHTKVLSAELGGKTLPKSEATWNGLLTEAIVQAAAKLKNVDALKEMMIINFVAGKKEEHGYRYIPSAGVSVQGQDANGAWKAVSHIVKMMHLPTKVLFVWYDNEKASNPGQTGKLTLNMP